MWPLGGLAEVGVPQRPAANLFTAAAGPLVNFIGCVIAGAALVIRTGSIMAIPWNPFYPYPQPNLEYLIYTSDLNYWIYQFFYVNYILLLFNVCLPVFPMDGGRIFQSICWFRMGYNRSMMLATTIGMVGSIALGCYGLFVPSFLLIGIAVFTYLTSMQQRKMIAMSRGWGYLQENIPATQTKTERRARKQQGKWEKKQQKLAKQQEQVDQILAKVHKSGINSLTPKEKYILRKATKLQKEQDRQFGRTDRL
jgi:hypothetical protein